MDVLKIIKGETAKTYLAKFASHYSLPPDHQIFKIVVSTPIVQGCYGGRRKKFEFPMLQSRDKMKTNSCERCFCCLTLYYVTNRIDCIM